MQPHGENLEATVEQAQAANPAKSEPTDTTLVKFILGGSTAPRSSRSTPSATLVLLYRDQKLEAQIATLLHHIYPWMQWSIAEVEERLARKMDKHTERKVKEVHLHLDTFELRVLAQPYPTVYVTAL